MSAVHRSAIAIASPYTTTMCGSAVPASRAQGTTASVSATYVRESSANMRICAGVGARGGSAGASVLIPRIIASDNQQNRGQSPIPFYFNARSIRGMTSVAISSIERWRERRSTQSMPA